MKSAAKWISIIGLGLVSLILAILLVIPLLVDVNRYKPFLEEKISAATGRSVHIGSDLKLSLFPWAGVAFSDLTMGHPAGSGKQPFLKVESFSAKAKLMPLLLKRDLQVEALVIQGPALTLIRQADGQVNGNVSAPKKPTPAPAGQRPPQAQQSPPDTHTADQIPIGILTVDRFSIENGTIRYMNAAGGTQQEVTDLNLTLRDITLDQPVPISASARWNNQPVSIEGSIGPTGRDIGQGTLPLDIALRLFEDLEIKLTGQVRHPAQAPRIEVALSVNPFSLKKLMNRLNAGQSIRTTDPAVLQRIHLTADIEADQKSASVSAGRLQLDDTAIDFSLNVRRFEPLSLFFQIDLDRMDLDRYLPPKTAAKPQGQPKAAAMREEPVNPAESSPATPVPDKAIYTLPRKFRVDGKIKATSMVVHRAPISDLRLTLKGQDGIFHIDPFSLKAYQGAISGNAEVRVKGHLPATRLDMRISGLQIGPLLRDQLQKDILEGTTQATIQLTMVGDQPEDIKPTLGGKGELLVTNGAIVGIDLADMVRNVQAAFGLAQQPTTGEAPRTDFTELRIPYTIDKGVVTTQDTRMQSPFLRLQAAGNADLARETLDFRIEPTFVGTIRGQGDTTTHEGIVVPVLVGGSFDRPTFKPDLKSIARQQLEREAVQKILQKKELKPYEKTIKGLLDGILRE